VRKTFQVALLAAACVFGASALQAQGTAPGSPRERNSASLTCPGHCQNRKAKQAGAELHSQFAPRQSELGRAEQADQRFAFEHRCRQRKFIPTASALQREGETKARQLQRKQDETKRRKRGAGRSVDRVGRKNGRLAGPLRARERYVLSWILRAKIRRFFLRRPI